MSRIDLNEALKSKGSNFDTSSVSGELLQNKVKGQVHDDTRTVTMK